MSFRLRFKYHLGSARGFLRSFRLPAWFYSRVFKVGISLMAVALSGVYVMATSSVATSGYEIRTLEKNIRALESDIQKLNAEVASSQSMSSIQRRLKELALVPADHINKLGSQSERAVARR